MIKCPRCIELMELGSAYLALHEELSQAINEGDTIDVVLINREIRVTEDDMVFYQNEPCLCELGL